MARVQLDTSRQALKAKQAQTYVKGINPLWDPDHAEKSGKELTTKQVTKMFDVTSMTIYNWRKTKAMPHYHLEGGEKPPVRYNEGQLRAWAEAHGIPLAADPY